MLATTSIVIRPATATDSAAIASLGACFHVEAGWSDIADYDESDCAAFLSALTENPDAIFLVVEGNGRILGMAAGIVMPLYFNLQHRHGQELFFWVDPEFRGRVGSMLLEAFEDCARGLGASSFAMVALDKVKPELTGRLYARRGYRSSEHYWVKRL